LDYVWPWCQVTPKLTKLSNILGVESRPFDPDTFNLEEEAGPSRLAYSWLTYWHAFAVGP